MGNITYKEFNGLVPNWVTKPFETPTIRHAEGTWAQFMLNCNGFTDPSKIQPGFQLTDVDATDASLVTTAVHAMDVGISAGTVAAYAICNADGSNNCNLFQITGTGFNDITNAGAWPHVIANVKAGYRNDCIVTWLNIGGTQTLCLLYSYNLSTTLGAGRLGRLQIASATFADTQYSLSTGTVQVAGSTDLWADRPMVKGTNGIIYVACGNVVDALDTTVQDPAIQLNVIDIPNDYKIKSLAFYRGQLIMVAQKNVSGVRMAGQVAVFIWNTTDPDTFQEEYYIKAQSCGASWADANELYIFTANANYGHIRKFDGQGFDIKPDTVEVPVTLPEHHGLGLFRDGFAFGSQGSVYAYASPRDDGKKQLWQIMGTSANISCIAQLDPNNDILHVAGGSSSFYIKKTDTSKYSDSAQYEFTSQDFPQRSTIDRIQTFFPTLATGADMLIRYLPNY